MRTLIVSIYDSGWEFNAASLSDSDYHLLDDNDTNELYNIYDYHGFEDYEKLMFEWAQNHDYDNVIISEDGRICFRN